MLITVTVNEGEWTFRGPQDLGRTESVMRHSEIEFENRDTTLNCPSIISTEFVIRVTKSKRGLRLYTTTSTTFLYDPQGR